MVSIQKWFLLERVMMARIWYATSERVPPHCVSQSYRDSLSTGAWRITLNYAKT